MEGAADSENPFQDPGKVLNSVEPEPTPARIDTDALNDYNPFQPPLEGPVSGFIGDSSTVSGRPPTYSALETARISTAELEKRQRELDARAAELERREAEQNRLAAEARTSGPGAVKNWPPLPKFMPCGPCFYQDIDVEIILEYRRIVRNGYYLWIAYVGLLMINLIGSICGFAGTGNGTTFGFAILACLFCTPASYICWFRPLYKAFKTNSSINFFTFFIVFGIQILVMLIQSLGFNACGWIYGLTALTHNAAIGGFILFIACGFSAITVLSTFYLMHVHRIYRTTGASFGKAREELARGIATDPAVRVAAMEGGLHAFSGKQ